KARCLAKLPRAELEILNYRFDNPPGDGVPGLFPEARLPAEFDARPALRRRAIKSTAFEVAGTEVHMRLELRAQSVLEPFAIEETGAERAEIGQYVHVLSGLAVRANPMATA